MNNKNENTTFDSVKFKGGICNHIATKQGEIISLINDLIDLNNWSSNNYRSEDSSLAASFSEMVNTLGTLKEKINTNLENLKQEIANYANATVSNEEQASSDVASVSTDLEGIQSQLNGIGSSKTITSSRF